CTLCRLGKLVERTRKYNTVYYGKGDEVFESAGTSIQDYHNLWPIPFAEIERNTEAVLEQNPGYTN
ncbi:MAG: RagB/SusD family nutrient uptake outer membrane protein, partial [Tannerellaceae bacterium]|nr:RagB/SusD family nutrient uptake outer membrane protein [Tannerellaceae bacterium]